MPVPFTEEALKHIASRIIQVQDFLGRKILIENTSSYINYTDSSMTEWAFLTELTKMTDCLLLLDINNVYVNSYNHRFDPVEFINAIPARAVQQFHLAGHTHKGTHILDTHDAPIIDEVWKLFRHALNRMGKVSTLIERDDRFPPFAELLEELQKAKACVEEVERYATV